MSIPSTRKSNCVHCRFRRLRERTESAVISGNGIAIMTFREYHKRWEFDLKSSPERLWPFIADTNRFNRDTGVPQIEVDVTPTNDFATRAAKYDSRFFGLPVEWEEQPFEWVKPFVLVSNASTAKARSHDCECAAELTPKDRRRHASDL